MFQHLRGFSLIFGTQASQNSDLARLALAGLSKQSLFAWRKFAWCTCPHGVVTLTSVLGLPCARFLSPVPAEPASEAESGGELG